jgi:hypothetical protein
VIETF